MDYIMRRVGEEGSIAVVRLSDGEVLFAHREHHPMIPASTLKLAVCRAALSRWGRSHRFPTLFFQDEEGWLYVKGLGDPCLVSEELQSVAAALSRRLEPVQGIRVDDSYFEEGMDIPGRGKVDEPYNAVVGALSSNFNTLLLHKRSDGTLSSKEPVTPLTPLARRLGRWHPCKRGAFWRNLPREDHYPALQTGHLLRMMLRREGVQISEIVGAGTVPQGLSPVYIHRSSKPLSEVLRLLLEYSNNMVANQILLSLGADCHGPPATLEQGRKVVRWYLKGIPLSEEILLVEGSGLSVENRASALALAHLTRAFHEHKDLMPWKEGVQAKTGTLTGVRALAGYLTLGSKEEAAFALLFTEKAPDRYEAVRWLQEALR